MRPKVPASIEPAVPGQIVCGHDILSLVEGGAQFQPFRYPEYDPGSLRLVSVAALLRPGIPAIKITEWRNLYLEENPTLTINRPTYAAISHVWKATEVVTRLSANRPFDIDIGNGELYHASWLGLIQAATAARKLDCHYLWLDLLCVHQFAADDKRLQVQNMSKIYKNAKAVLVMFGGCAAVQGIEHHSSWIERAWTLQESTTNKDTYALIDMSAFPQFETQKICTIASVGVNIERLEDGIGLVELQELLKVDIHQPLGWISYPGQSEQDSNWCSLLIKCFGDSSRAIRTLRIVFDGINSDGSEHEAIVKSAAWSCIWMRTSTKPQDMVFSLMHLLGVELTVDYNRSLEDLFIELVQRSSETPVWLTIAPDVEVTVDSGLIPMLPHFRPNSLPIYHTGLSEKPAFKCLIDIDCMTTCRDIIVHSKIGSNRFELCGTVMDVMRISEEFTVVTTGVQRRNISFPTPNGAFHSQCTIFRDIGEIAMVAGQLWKKSTAPDVLCDIWIIFLNRSDSRGWKKVGQGILTIREREKELLSKLKRRHVEVGTTIESSVCDCWPGKKKGQFNFPCRLTALSVMTPSEKPNTKRSLSPFSETEDIRSKRPRTHVEQQSSILDEKDRQCLKDLRTTDPRDDKARIEKNKGGLLEDSYRWILENADFRQWHDNQQSRLLWIKGDPGKGKTMLLCGIINELKTSTVKTDLLSFFFCEGTDVRINNATAVLRGLIYMLVDQQPSLIRYIREKYDRAGKALFEDVNAWVALCGIFANILQDPSLKNTYLIIDALDECRTEDLPQLLDFIVQMSSAFPHVKWVVSSRNWRNIEEQLETAEQKVRLSLELNATSISAAVSTYIRHKVLWLARLKNYDDETRDAVQDHLSSNANDTFLWVALVCQNLAQIPRLNTRTKLNEFPAGLDPLYRRMMEQVCNSDNANLCKWILAIITVVYRPITLKELTSFVEMPGIASNDLESLTEIIGLSGSFLTLRESTVHFVHQSAKDFLLEKASDEIFVSGVGDVHYTIFSRSLEVMSRTLRRDMYGLCAPGFPIGKVEQPDPDPLAAAGYSCIYWVDHLCDWDSSKSVKYRDDIQDRGAVDKFLRQKYLYWLEALSLLRSVSEGVLSMEKLEGLLQVSLKSIVLSRKRSNITLGKSRGITIDRLSPRCSPIYSLLQVGNREHSSPDIHISTRLQSGSQPDERIIQAGGARMDYNQAGYAR